MTPAMSKATTALRYAASALVTETKLTFLDKQFYLDMLLPLSVVWFIYSPVLLGPVINGVTDGALTYTAEYIGVVYLIQLQAIIAVGIVYYLRQEKTL